MQKFFNYIEYHSDKNNIQKIELKNYIRNIIYFSNNFVKDSIQFYTSENFYYLIKQ